MLLGRLSAGSPLPVKVDPSDPQDVIIDGGPETPAASSAFASWPTTSTVIDGGTTVVDGGTTIVGGADTMAQLQSALAARGMSAADQAATMAKVQAALAARGMSASWSEPGTAAAGPYLVGLADSSVSGTTGPAGGPCGIACGGDAVHREYGIAIRH